MVKAPRSIILFIIFGGILAPGALYASQEIKELKGEKALSQADLVAAEQALTTQILIAGKRVPKWLYDLETSTLGVAYEPRGREAIHGKKTQELAALCHPKVRAFLVKSADLPAYQSLVHNSMFIYLQAHLHALCAKKTDAYIEKLRARDITLLNALDKYSEVSEKIYAAIKTIQRSINDEFPLYHALSMKTREALRVKKTIQKLLKPVFEELYPQNKGTTKTTTTSSIEQKQESSAQPESSLPGIIEITMQRIFEPLIRESARQPNSYFYKEKLLPHMKKAIVDHIKFDDFFTKSVAPWIARLIKKQYKNVPSITEITALVNTSIPNTALKFFPQAFNTCYREYIDAIVAGTRGSVIAHLCTSSQENKVLASCAKAQNPSDEIMQYMTLLIEAELEAQGIKVTIQRELLHKELTEYAYSVVQQTIQDVLDGGPDDDKLRKQLHENLYACTTEADITAVFDAYCLSTSRNLDIIYRTLVVPEVQEDFNALVFDIIKEHFEHALVELRKISAVQKALGSCTSQQEILDTLWTHYIKTYPAILRYFFNEYAHIYLEEEVQGYKYLAKTTTTTQSQQVEQKRTNQPGG